MIHRKTNQNNTRSHGHLQRLDQMSLFLLSLFSPEPKLSVVILVFAAVVIIIVVVVIIVVVIIIVFVVIIVVVVIVVINVINDVIKVVYDVFSLSFLLDCRFSLTTPTTSGSDAAK